jgi:hypothetical protein
MKVLALKYHPRALREVGRLSRNLENGWPTWAPVKSVLAFSAEFQHVMVLARMALQHRSCKSL